MQGERALMLGVPRHEVGAGPGGQCAHDAGQIQGRRRSRRGAPDGLLDAEAQRYRQADGQGHRGRAEGAGVGIAADGHLGAGIEQGADRRRGRSQHQRRPRQDRRDRAAGGERRDIAHIELLEVVHRARTQLGAEQGCP